jgi:hypothetical protein
MTRGTILALLVAGCGSGAKPNQPDAAADAALDAQPDAACIRTLLAGGTDVAAQGWTVASSGPATLTNGPDYAQLETSTMANQTTGGHLLLTLPGAVSAPFKLEVVMLVQAVNPHNPSDAAAAIMASFTPPFGMPTERSQMIYLDAGAIGWADNSQSQTATVTDGSYHTYVLSVDASNVATLTMDGNPLLTRNGFATNGTVAIGDQTNEPNVDSTLRLRSVRLLCL